MTPEVKQRIEQIRQGIVPEGYVKDKDGIYPRDWASKKIGQWLKLAERSIVLQDEEEYQLVTIRRGFGGVDSRGSFLGKNVLVKNYFIVKTGDFIISKRQIAHGACGIVPPELDGAVVSNEYNVFLPQDGTNIQMFNLMMQLPHYKRLFYLMSDGVHIEKLLFKTQDWMKRTLAMPLLKEQKKIAEILSTQDKAIELQGRKIEELKRFKKGCLEKMFPRKGQKVPETRFPGFTGDWEQRKVSTIASDTRGGGTPATSNETYWSGNIPWIQSSDLSEGKLFGVEPRKYISRDGLNNSATQLVPENSIAVVTRVGVGKLAFMPFSYTTSQDFLSLCKLQTEPHFTVYALYQMLQGELQAVQGTSIKGMTKDDLLSKSIFAPKDEVEQQQLGSYFRNLDTLITLHQRKLEEMKKQKKALMQLLLTGIVKTKGEVR
jgi:type I restriction enzyme S subunit